NRIAVVSQHFPGYGASDRALDEPQLPTVSKTLDELQAIDLAPFFDVVQVGAPDSTDALLVSHIRYRGLQGNIRDTTRPISLDQQALSDLLNLPELAAWRANGGVTVSDALGVRAVRRFYDPSERTFNAYAIARDAFLAGNDVLYLGQFASAGADRNAHIKDVLAQFVQKYQEDPAFAQRVDAAVTRIIALKFKLYGDFNWGSVQPEVPLNALGTGSLDSLAATTAAATLLSPAPAELANRLPTPPGLNHQIAFFTDTRIVKQCSSCAARPSIPVDALENAVLKLYGSAGTSEISSLNLNSFSFVDLADFLDSRPTPVTPTPSPEPSPTPEGATPEPTPTAAPPGVAEALDEADWIVFAMLDVKEGIAESSAVSRILAERPALLQDKRVIVFALDAPYYLDATDVAQLTAYYALYSRSSAAIEVAARILFQEITPSGASPVSVESVGYKLIDATQPDPDQIIELAFEIQPTEGATPSPVDVTITPSPPSVKLGDLLTFRTGLIVDRNGRPVPDGTVVKFYVTYGEVPIPGQFAEATTVDGVATTTFRLDRAGFFEFRVSSEPALGSFLLQFTVPDEGIGGAPIVITPTPGPTDTAPPTAPPTETPTPGITPTPIPPPPPITPSVTWIDLLMTILTLSVMGGIAWRVTNSRVEAVSAGVKLILIIAIGALAGYNYYALKLPGAAMVSVLGFWAVPLMVWSGGLIGFGVGWWWLKRSVRAGQ
ncbi:MAG TPA: glycoside hydrolase family 3 N-terminal domain-containing protein, partial [Anaerolineales bacterium]|nr:glycoside hydrolase family 3 N-terminal domain-containing protein [Anaerolineales bacterium]